MAITVSVLQMGLTLVAGALSTLSPCVFPLLPVVVGSVAHTHHRTGPIAMAAGMVAAFVFLGVALGAVGPALGIGAGHFRVVAGTLLVVIAAIMLMPEAQEHTPAWLSGLASMAQRASTHLHPETIPGAFVLGGLLGLVWSPCSGPLLGSGLALVATEGGLLNGALILGLFGVGAALPLMAAAYASRALFARMRGWVLGHSQDLRRGFAVLIGLMGVAILTGADRWLEAKLLDMLPDAWLELTTRF
ncbi:cytochrome c biogenesis CcdA family protein [Burkholderiaceae bacterium FT117]|uniref:cytochrome c biogenesis CcdA family protein n=1 Tax=Zeimonas sediminis TaxID=2944268 RepID=UPI002342D94B|nr:cytochrome c biogenesis CcdA family protein [Zeimonas sediminis]MCM5569564.1 cytochrome c biogenesis CcdA family protein [Zeimonas sediminis]